MTDASLEQSVNRMLTQARNFAARENYIDAVARVEYVLTKLGDGHDMLRARAEGELADYRARHAAWAKAIRERREATVDGAADEMARPLPVPAPGA